MDNGAECGDDVYMMNAVVTFRLGSMTYLVHSPSCKVAVRAASAKKGGRAEFVTGMTAKEALEDAQDRVLNFKVCPCAKGTDWDK